MTTSENKEFILHKSQEGQTLPESQLLKALYVCQSDIQINNVQIKGLLQLLITNLMQINENVKKNKKEDESQIDIKKQSESRKTQEIPRKDHERQTQKISFQQQYKGQLVIFKKEMKNELQRFQKMLQFKYKLLNQKIQEQSYQTQKKLYEKFTVIFGEINNDINLSKNHKQEIRENKFMDQSNRDAQSLDFNQIYQQSQCNQYEEQKMSKRRLMSQSFTQSQYYSKKKGNYRFTSMDIASLTNKQLGLKFKNKKDIKSKNNQIVIKSEADKRQLIIVSDNIKTEGFKKSCKIKIKKVKSWIALGIIDFNMRMKPAKNIGQRWVYYCNDGQIWSGKKSYFNQSSKFNVGEVVEVSYDQISKIVEWRVKNQLKYSLKCMKLEYNQNWVPFIYFFNKGDEVVLMPVQK